MIDRTQTENRELFRMTETVPMPSQDILDIPPPAADARLSYGADPNQFGDLRLPQTNGPFPLVMNIHGGFWRSKFDLAHAGHLCAALAAKGIATWNIEYRRVGDPGGGWSGTFEDIRAAYRYLPHIAKLHNVDSTRVLIMGHSAGGQLAICLAAHESSITRVVSLAGVVDVRQAWEQQLSDNAVAAFLGGRPEEKPEHYRVADPMQLKINHATTQMLIHGAGDDIVPSYFSRQYVEQKKNHGEDVQYVEISNAGHLDLIDPSSNAWRIVEGTVRHMLA